MRHTRAQAERMQAGGQVTRRSSKAAAASQSCSAAHTLGPVGGARQIAQSSETAPRFCCASGAQSTSESAGRDGGGIGVFVEVEIKLDKRNHPFEGLAGGRARVH